MICESGLHTQKGLLEDDPSGLHWLFSSWSFSRLDSYSAGKYSSRKWSRSKQTLGKSPGWRPPQTWHFNASSPTEGKQDMQYTFHKTKDKSVPIKKRKLQKLTNPSYSKFRAYHDHS